MPSPTHSLYCLRTIRHHNAKRLQPHHLPPVPPLRKHTHSCGPELCSAHPGAVNTCNMYRTLLHHCTAITHVLQRGLYCRPYKLCRIRRHPTTLPAC